MSWVFGPGADPGGANGDIQFNSSGSFSGSALLTTDGAGSLSASTHVSASTYYGDGSNLTGVTASAVQVADGPQYSLQFRYDSPVSGELSGNVLLMSDGAGAISASSNISASNFYLAPGKSIFFNGNTETAKITNNGTNLDINSPGSIILNAPTQVSASSNLSASNFYTNNYLYADRAYLGVAGSGFIVSRTDPTTFIKMQTAGGNNSINFTLGGTKLIDIAENGSDQIVLGAAASNIVHVSGSLTASVGMKVSASAAIGEDIIVGSGTARTIGVLLDSGDDFFVMGHDAGAVTLSASQGVEFIGGSEGVGSFGSDIKVYETQEGNNTTILLSTTGSITLSGSFSGQQRSKIIFGDNENSKLERIHDSGDELLRLTSEDAGIDISGSNALGVSIYGGDGAQAGVLIQGANGLTVVNAAGNAAAVDLAQDGTISGSGQLQGASVAVDGIVQTHRVQIDNGSQLGTDSDTDMITLNNGSDVTIASDLELRVGNLTQNRVATVGANSKLTDHSNFTFASDVLSVPTITASVGISSSLLIVEPTSGSLAGAGSYLGLNANNQIIVTSSAGGGGGTPGGSNTEVQFNDGGSFGGDSTFTFNKTSNVLSVPTITASVGVLVTSSANGSISIGEGVRYIFNGDDRLDVFENEFRLRKTNLYQAVFPEQTSNFDIGDSQIYLVDTNSSVVTGTLPGVTSTDDYGLTFTIKDSGGNAGTNDIIINPSGSQKIDGATSAKIATNYGAMTVVAISSSVNGFGWGIVSAT